MPPAFPIWTSFQALTVKSGTTLKDVSKVIWASFQALKVKSGTTLKDVLKVIWASFQARKVKSGTTLKDVSKVIWAGFQALKVKSGTTLKDKNSTYPLEKWISESVLAGGLDKISKKKAVSKSETASFL